jgi:3-methyladenine DNA glycosylase/8-oxoguanine DNA glycosylase
MNIQERVNDEALGPQTYIADATAIQLETAVTEAVKEVERFEAAENTAAEKVENIERMLFDTEAELQQAEEDRWKVSINRMGAYWTLGRAIKDLEAALANNKGKHTADTPRKRAIELAGNNARYQRAKDVGSHFSSRADAEKAAVAQSFNAILKEIAEKKSEDRQAQGQQAPGRKPTASKIAKVATPVANKPPVAEEDEASEEDNDQSAAEEIITIRPSVTPEELAAVNTFVTAVGGWERAIFIIEKGHEKWQQNQNS